MATKRSKAIAIKPDEEWKCEMDLNTLLEAEKIKADPKRYEKAKAYAKKKMMEAAAVATDD